MNDFLWASGHLGWGIFAVAVFTGLWLLLADLYWRLKNIKTVRLAAIMATGWLIGVVLILVFFHVFER